MEGLFDTALRILEDRIHDLVLRIEDRPDDAGFEWLRRQLGPDPRVRFGAPGAALDDFPGAAFHITVPAGVEIVENLVFTLRNELGGAVSGSLILAGGVQVSIVRTWALHRSRRSGAAIADLGPQINMKADKLVSAPDPKRWSRKIKAWRRLLRAGVRRVVGAVWVQRWKVRRVYRRLLGIRSPRQAWWFLKWMASSMGRRIGAALRRVVRYMLPSSTSRWLDPPDGRLPARGGDRGQGRAGGGGAGRLYQGRPAVGRRACGSSGGRPSRVAGRGCGRDAVQASVAGPCARPRRGARWGSVDLPLGGAAPFLGACLRSVGRQSDRVGTGTRVRGGRPRAVGDASCRRRSGAPGGAQRSPGSEPRSPCRGRGRVPFRCAGARRGAGGSGRYGSGGSSGRCGRGSGSGGLSGRRAVRVDGRF